MSSGHHGTWCRGSRAVTPCLSSHCYHDFSISVNFKLRAYRSCTSLASGLSSSRITATHWYASRISRTSPQRTPVASRWCVRVRHTSSSKFRGLSKLSRGFVFGWLVAPLSPTARSRPTFRYILDLPQSSPSLPAARSMASPTPEYSTTVFQVHRRGSNPLSSLSLIPAS